MYTPPGQFARKIAWRANSLRAAGGRAGPRKPSFFRAEINSLHCRQRNALMSRTNAANLGRLYPATVA